MKTKTRLAKPIAAHAVILLLVVLLPPLIYDWIENSRASDIDGLEFIGGLTYPLYAAYWVAKLTSGRAKFIIGYFIFFLTANCLTATFGGNHSPDRQFVVVMVTGVLPLISALYLAIARKWEAAKTCLFAALLSFPAALVIAFFLALGAGLSAMPKTD